MTKVEVYSTIKALVDREISIDSLDIPTVADILERMNKDIEAANKKGTTSAPRVNAAKAQLMEDIKGVLTDSLTIPQIIEALGSDYLYGEKKLNSQIVSQALTALGDGTEKNPGTHEVVRTVIKKVAYFALAE